MKTYTVIRSNSGEVGCVVSDGTGTATVLRRCAYHSQTGFETGYPGTGPADLALSILADHYNASPEQVEHVGRFGFIGKCVGAEKAMLYHQCVKFRFIAPFDRKLNPGEQYTITVGELDAYLEEILHRSKTQLGGTNNDEVLA